MPSIVQAVLRGAALFLAGFTLIGIVGEVRGRTIDPSLWWVDIRDVPAVLRLILLAVLAGLLGAWAAGAAPGRRVRRATAISCLLFALLAARDVLRFYAAAGVGDVRPVIDVPLSAFIALLLVGLAVEAIRESRPRPVVRRRDALGLALAVGAWAIAFPLAQMLFFGTTDYRRPADVAVVFGARVYASGQPSPLLADRIQTGVDLYRSGLVRLLVMSGGDGTDGFNEARVMRDVAVADGVDPAAIVVDPVGNTTEATVANLSALIAGQGGRPGSWRVIAVSQAYHLPRVQLAFADAGIDAITVPAADPQPIGEMPLLVAREVPAFWAYFVRVCLL